MDEPDGDNPWDGSKNLSKTSLAKTILKTDSSSSDYKSEPFKLFSLDRSQMRNDAYIEACITFEELLASYPESRFSPFTLQRWIQCKFVLDSKDDVLSYLEELRKSKSKSLLDHIDKMEVLVQRKSGNPQTALSLISAYKNTSKSNAYNSFFKFQEGLTYKYDLNDLKQSEAVFMEYLADYPADRREPLVQKHLNALSAANQSMAKNSSPDADKDNEGNFPQRFVLQPAYPNPFNPTTTFSFYSPWAGKAKLEIFNAVGQRIRALEKTQFSKGYHKIYWNGRNDSGRSVTSGVYFVRFTANSEKQANLRFEKFSKIIFLK